MILLVQSQRESREVSKLFGFSPDCLVAEAAEEAAIAFGYGHGHYTFGITTIHGVEPLEGLQSLAQSPLSEDSSVWIVFNGSKVGA